jgi:MFS family permease
VPIVGRLYDRFGARWLAFLGLVLVTLATYLLCGINVNLTRHEVIIWTVIRGVRPRAGLHADHDERAQLAAA